MNLGGHILSTALFHSDVLLTQLTLKRYCCSSLPHHPQAPLRMPVLLGATKWLLDPIDEKGKRKERERGIVTLFLICNMSQHLLATLCLLPLVHNVSSCLYFRNFLHNVSSSMILFSFFGDSNSGLVASPQSSLCVNVFRIYLEIISSHFLCLFDLYSQALFLCFYPHSLITSLLLFWFLWFFFSLYLFSEFCKCARLFSLVFWPFLLWDYIFILFILPYWVYFFVKSLKVMATCSVKIFTCFLANRWFHVAGKFCSNFLSFFFSVLRINAGCLWTSLVDLFVGVCFKEQSFVNVFLLLFVTRLFHFSQRSFSPVLINYHARVHAQLFWLYLIS